MRNLVEAHGVTRSYPARGLKRQGHVLALDGVSLTVARAETLAVVGESGSGKSTLARLLLALERPDAGRVSFDGHPISDMPESRVRPLRRRMQPVFQDPYASLNPRLRISTIIAEPLRAHGLGGHDRGRAQVVELLDLVGLPEHAADRFPAAFSGGERQRIAIARALATRPELVVLDEPVSALDVGVRSHILFLLSELKRRLQLTMVLISHDLNVVADLADRVIVLHRGRVIEQGPTSTVLGSPGHPVTQSLLAASRAIRARMRCAHPRAGARGRSLRERQLGG